MKHKDIFCLFFFPLISISLHINKPYYSKIDKKYGNVWECIHVARATILLNTADRYGGVFLLCSVLSLFLGLYLCLPVSGFLSLYLCRCVFFLTFDCLCSEKETLFSVIQFYCLPKKTKQFSSVWVGVVVPLSCLLVSCQGFLHSSAARF